MYAVADLLNTTLPFLHHKKERIFHRKLSDVHDTFPCTEHWLLKEFLKISAMASSLHVDFQRSGLKHKPTVCTPENGFLSTCLVSWRNRWLSALTRNSPTIPNLEITKSFRMQTTANIWPYCLFPAFLVVSSNRYSKIGYVSSPRASQTTYQRI